jgi:hypothetical protein
MHNWVAAVEAVLEIPEDAVDVGEERGWTRDAVCALEILVLICSEAAEERDGGVGGGMRRSGWVAIVKGCLPCAGRPVDSEDGGPSSAAEGSATRVERHRAPHLHRRRRHPSCP